MSKKKTKRTVTEVDPQELAAIIERTKSTSLEAEDVAKLQAAMSTLVFLQTELQQKGTSIERLKRMLFGAPTEKGARGGADKQRRGARMAPKPPASGHGRNPAAAYVGAERRHVPHAQVNGGEECAGCHKGKVYPVQEPAVLVRVTGMAPLSATVWECERLRCNLCGEVYTAEAPEGVGTEKYDESATAMTALLKYGCGLPLNRIEKLQSGMGIPLPSSTQWELLEAGAGKLAPAFEELVRQAAQADVLHNDDTTMKVLALSKEQLLAAAAGAPLERTGVFTSGILATSDKRAISLFFTGRQHAGENLADVLRRRGEELKAPVQMSDALSSNAVGDLKVIAANCLVHARRGFFDVVDKFPEECDFVLEKLGLVYKTDAAATANALDPAERLALHQAESAPVMADLKDWLDEQLAERKVEPNSGLGTAIQYMRRHWTKLTLFLREPGAPLDNNVCERALKKAILHRKNSLFFRTMNGAHVGDLFMSLIHTVELGGGNPFDYLVALLRHHELVADAPEAWMPWNYHQELSSLRSSAG